jgi:allophanate hydrolase subunit 1
MDEAMSDYERRYAEVQRALEAAHAQLQTNPPDTVLDLLSQMINVLMLLDNRATVVLESLVARVEQLERRIESLEPPSP